ncbi:MAG: 2-C-methyl-D-erythritol 4-phosphate cytidylyltransferase [Acidobacteria bacterium]|nr:2-C-methyl-D-erythritol 4-phosphate cytidylyltransferase [Acidobacteriota bacterium]
MIGVVVAAAGTGSRFGSEIPKQFLRSQGKSIYLHSLDRLCALVSQCVLVVSDGWLEPVRTEIQSLPFSEKITIARGGEKRQDSVYNGLCQLVPEVDIVLVHDAARPFFSPDLVVRVVEGTRLHQACVPCIPVSDTVKEVRNSRVIRTLKREHLYLSQTPQGFQRRLLEDAFARAISEGFYATDESMLIERLGFPVHVVPGDPGNVKITWRSDLERK